MKGIAQILWIDDELAAGAMSEPILRVMQRAKGIEVTPSHPTALSDHLAENFDLYLVDYRLDKQAGSSNKKYEHTGISIAGLVRDKFPDLPIYLTSALILGDASAQGESELFDRLVSHQSLTRKEGIAALRSDALDYRSIRTSKARQARKSIHLLLKTPAHSQADVNRVLPEGLQHGLGVRQSQRASDKPSAISSGSIRFGKWVIHQLLVHPGVLYDDLYAATYLGMTQKYFTRRFAKIALKSRYVGVFARTTDPRWWKGSLTNLVVGHPAAKKHGPLRIAELATKVFSVAPRDQPRCVACKEPFPETVAYDRDNPARRGPAHLGCSEPDPNRKPLLYFEPYRVFVE